MFMAIAVTIVSRAFCASCWICQRFGSEIDGRTGVVWDTDCSAPPSVLAGLTLRPSRECFQLQSHNQRAISLRCALHYGFAARVSALR